MSSKLDLLNSIDTSGALLSSNGNSSTTSEVMDKPKMFRRFPEILKRQHAILLKLGLTNLNLTSYTLQALVEKIQRDKDQALKEYELKSKGNDF